VFAFEGFLAGVSAHVDLDVALVQETAIANLTMMHHLLLVAATAASGSRTPATDAVQLWPDPAAVFLLDLRQASQLVKPPLKPLI
jgi:hypothetical protein